MTSSTAGTLALPNEAGAEHAADARTREGTAAICFAGSIHFAADEICFVAFDTASSEDAELVATRAGLDPLRLIHAVHRHSCRCAPNTRVSTRTS